MESIHKIQHYYKLIAIVIALFFNLNLNAQEYPVANIPDSLKEDAVAVVRYESEQFIQNDINTGKYLVTKVITVLHQDGKDYADLYVSGDKFTELSSFSGIIYNAFGKEIKKIKKGDLSTSNLILDNIVDGAYVTYYKYTPPNYPYTIKYQYEIKSKNGIIAYPYFSPISGRLISCEKSEFSIDIPSSLNLRYKECYKSNITQETKEGRTIYRVSSSNLKAIPKENYAPIADEIYPRVYFSPSDFCYDQHCGNMDNWNIYGAWLTELLKDRDILPDNLVQEIRQLVLTAKDDRDKVKILYEYMQSKTRYFYVGYGIGGYQPLPASFVAKNNYGDCKALSNYMKAILKSVGITSHYTEIGIKTKNIFPNYPNFHQTDHAILAVPMQNDTIWLECTSQTLPFGYVHSGIAGHNAIVVKEDENKGVFVRLPVYKDEESYTASKMIIDLKEGGSASVQFSVTEHLNRYRYNVNNIISNDREKQTKYINGALKLPRVHIGDISTSEVRSERPSCTISANIEVDDYGNTTGSRLFIPICPLNKINFNFFSAEKRVFDIYFEEGYYWSDSITINIPDSYTIESLPKDINLKTKFGHHNTSISVDGNKIIYSQKMALYKGRYPNTDYKELKNFLRQLQNSIKRRVTLKKI